MKFTFLADFSRTFFFNAQDKLSIYKGFTSYIRGPRTNALSTHLPVRTTSAPSSKALAMGRALIIKQK